MFRLSSSFLITTAKPPRLQSSDPDTAFPPDSLPPLLFCFPVAGAPLIRKAEEPGEQYWSRGAARSHLALPFGFRPGTFSTNHSVQAATVPGIINNRTTDICSLFMGDRKLAHTTSPWRSQGPCRVCGAYVLTLYR